tara:strand:+ start:132 stop:497 length:366 start_codon:yes stop_codon:yes gene_type:complete
MSTIFAAADIVDITITVSDVLSSSTDHLPKKLDIRHAHPNPFNNSVSISFEIPNSKNVNLSIFDMKGRKVRQMSLGKLKNGFHNVVWDGKNNLGNELSSGIYMAVLEIGDKFNVQKISLVK